jgi:tricorn protease
MSILPNRTTHILMVAIICLQAPGAQPLGFAQQPQVAAAASAQTTKAAPSFSEPAIAPDRAEIAFVSGGDIWTAPLAAGSAATPAEAHLLIANPAYDSRPRYSPDGKRLAFVSTRTGNGDIYVYTFATGEVRRLTFEDSPEWLDAWSRDGKWLYFTSNSNDIAGMNDVFRVSSEGGTSMLVSGDRYAPEFFAAPGPDGTVAINARGNQAFGQWWRKGHSHIDESEIWLVKEGSTPTYQRLSAAGGAKQVWPMWSADARTVYFVSDRSGAQNIWAQSSSPGSEARQITKFQDGRVLWPVISYDGKTIVFERDFGIWKLDTSSGQASAVPLTRRSAPQSPESQHLTLNSQFQELVLSPDGKKIAFIAHGEVFAASAKDGGNAKRVTYTVPPESNPAWSTDSKQIVYSSARDGDARLFLYDFTSDKEMQLTQQGPGNDSDAIFSPDGKYIAFERDGREVRLYDIAQKQDRLLSSSDVRRSPAPLVWSPDSKWLAFYSLSNKDFRNVFVAPVSGATSEAKPVTFLSNTFGGPLVWSPDGSYLLFVSGQRTEESMLARVNLVPRTPKFREDQFKELFQDRPGRPPNATGGGGASGGQASTDKPSPKPVEVDFTDIRRRLQIINSGLDAGNVIISPDGKTLLLVAAVANQLNLYTYPYDELSREPAVARQLTSTPEGKSSPQFSPDGKEVYFLGGGRVQVINVDTRQARPINVTAEMDVDFQKEKMAVFQQAWSIKRDTFYDPKFHGVDWNAVHEVYASRIAGAATPDEMRRLLNLMVGELNASHSGVGAPGAGGGGGAPGPGSGRLGLRFDRIEYENNGRLRVTEVIALSPAAISGIKSGEYLLSIDGKSIGAHISLEELMAYTSGRRVEATVSASADGAGKRSVTLMPVSINAEKQLLYRQWVEERRAYVEKVSGGRLGYAHMIDMGAGSLAQLYVDLDVENHGREGVVIDVRNNNGGFVNVYAIDVLARRPYLNMTFRGRNAAAPARSTLGQRALELPTALVVNQHSLSDAEDFTEGYRALKLGKVIGEPTAGWIIYTGGQTLLDGSSIRTPQIRITDNTGQTMEMNPRQVDVPVTRPVGESYSGKDSQLDAAVAELLKQIGKK